MIKKIHSTRQQMLSILPKNAVIAELGVAAGKLTYNLITPLCNPVEYHLIDIWKHDTNELKDVKRKKQYKETKSRAKIIHKIHRDDSVKVMSTFPDNYFDWVYVDGEHSYEGCLRDLEICRLKVKDDGYIAGHDFEIFKSEDKRRWGVVKAVTDFCKKHNYELTHLTNNDKLAPSYILEKLK